MKRLKTTAPMETSSESSETTVKKEPVEAISKPEYIVKVKKTKNSHRDLLVYLLTGI